MLNIMRKTITLVIILTANITYSQVPNYVPTSGLFGWWPFNGNANDESGNGNNGTVNGNVFLSSDRFGNSNQAYSFPGNSSSYIDVNNSMSLQIQQSLSISVWLYMEGGFANPRIIHFGNGSSGYGMFVNGTSNISRKLDALFANDGGSGTGFCCGNQGNGIDIPSLSWQHIAFTVDSDGNSKLYHNSILMASANGVTVNNAVYTTNLNIGRLTNASDAWGGMLDDIGIWNRALTQTEITALYTGVLSSETFTNTTNFQLYPNPANDFMQFKCTAMVEKISIYNTLGQLVQENKTNATEGSISIEHLAQGSYFVKINNQNTSYTLLKN